MSYDFPCHCDSDRLAPWLRCGVFASLVALLSGCQAYRFGNATLYAPDVQTVYVPMVVSDSFRRDLGERLTEAIIKEIQLKTPYTVVDTPDADSALVAQMTGDAKRVIVENQNDDARVVEAAMYATVTWYNRRREPLGPPSMIPLPPGIGISQTEPILAEAGQSVAMQQQLAIQRLAEQIVATMEEPW